MGVNCSANCCASKHGHSMDGGDSRPSRPIDDPDSITVHAPAIKITQAQDISMHFIVGSKIGEGTFAHVVTGIDKKGGSQRAIKCVEKSHAEFKQSTLNREVSTMEMLEHPNVVKLMQHIDTPSTAYLVMELCDGGDLLDKIIAEKELVPDDAAAQMSAQMLRAIEHLHDNGVAHRDIKPENFLILRKGSLRGNNLKLSDFGLADFFDMDSPNMFEDSLGTIRYVAPEVVSGEVYGPECDLWGCGATIYTMLSRSVPFVGDPDTVLAALRSGAKWTFHAEAWQQVSDESKALVTRLMEINPNQRYSAHQALLDPWLSELTLQGDQQYCCSLANAAELGLTRRTDSLLSASDSRP